MRRGIGLLALAIVLASGSAVFAQQFDRKNYDELVDASSPDTIPPGTKITLQNWTQYKRFMMVWMQLAFSGKVAFPYRRYPRLHDGSAAHRGLRDSQGRP